MAMAIFGKSVEEDLPDETPINSEVELGDIVRDTISGFQGIASSTHTYLNGCVRIGVGGTNKDGEPTDFVFDVQQLEIVEKQGWKSPQAPQPAAISVGGPRDSSVPGATRTM